MVVLDEEERDHSDQKYGGEGGKRRQKEEV